MAERRSTVSKKIQAKTKKIKDLEKEIFNLKIQEMKISDKNQQYKEGIEEVLISKRPKKTEKIPIGRVHWKEDFVDEDTHEVVTINRSSIVRRGNVWYV